MAIQLTSEQWANIEPQGATPVPVSDPSQTVDYVLLRADLYNRFRALFEDVPVSHQERQPSCRVGRPSHGCLRGPRSAEVAMRVARGEIVLVDYPFSDRTGSKVRPALVVQTDTLNARIDDTILVAISRSTHRVSATQLLIDLATPDGAATGLRQTSTIQCENLLTSIRRSSSPRSDNSHRLKCSRSMPAYEPLWASEGWCSLLRGLRRNELILRQPDQ